MGAISAAIKRIVCFDSMTDDFDAAVLANGCEAVNRAFEAVKNVRCARRHYFKRQIIIVAANFTLRH